MDFHSRSPLLFASCHPASGLLSFVLYFSSNARKANTFELFIYFFKKKKATTDFTVEKNVTNKLTPILSALLLLSAANVLVYHHGEHTVPCSR